MALFGLFWGWVCVSQLAFAQDPQVSQFYAAPLVQNPAFAGLAQRSRLVFQYRSQWTGTGQPIKTTYASGDLYIPQAKSGLGLVIGRTSAMSSVFQGTEARLAYSLHQALTKKLRISYGLQLGFDQRNLGYSQLTFGDQIDSSGRYRPSIDPSAQDRTYTMPELGGGLVLYGKSSYLSLSARHLNNPKLSADAGAQRLPIWLSITGGYVWTLADATALHDYYPAEVTVAFLYKQQGPFRQLDLGTYYTLQPLVLGIWYRGLPFVPSVPGVFNEDALSFLIGLRQDNLSIGYSYDVNLSGLVPMYAGSHEISVGYTFDKRVPRQKIRHALPCPSF